MILMMHFHGNNENCNLENVKDKARSLGKNQDELFILVRRTQENLAKSQATEACDFQAFLLFSQHPKWFLLHLKTNRKYSL